MIVLIDIAIIILGLSAFLLAFAGTTIGESSLLFGGDRWSDEEAALYKRITARGWFALLCLLATIGLVFGKKEIQEQKVQEAASTRVNTEAENKILRERISNHVTNILSLQKENRKAGDDLTGLKDQIEAHHLLSIESAFKLSHKPLREKDETLVHLDGHARIPLMSRFQGQMHLLGGDRFYFVTFVQNLSERDLKSIQLEHGDKVYSLFDGQVSGLFERTLRLPGNPIKPMPAVIRNPLLLNNLTFKIIIRPREIFRGQEVFRELILSSPFSTFAKSFYKQTTADMLNVRLHPSPSAKVITRLPRGSFVQKIQEENGWIKVLTPQDKQGWVTKRFLAEIE